MPKPIIGVARREPCTKCGLPVVIAERLHVNNQLYHRTCFSCSRCNAQLTLADYCETEIDNQFCCETCPDEDPAIENLSRSMSDEEKSSINKFDDKDDYYSDLFETALEETKDDVLSKRYTIDTNQTSAFVQARSNFITSQLDDFDSEIPDLPESVPPILTLQEPPDLLKFVKKSDGFDLVDHLKDNVSDNDSALNSHLDCNDVNSCAELSDSDKNQPETANNLLENITKENVVVDGVVVTEDTINSSDDKHEEEKCEDLNTSVITIDSEDSLDIILDNKNLLTNETVITISSDDDAKNDSQDSSNPFNDENDDNDDIMQKEKEYPEDLNPFGDDDEEIPKVSLNPFDDEGDDEDLPKPNVRKKIPVTGVDRIAPMLYTTRISINPNKATVESPAVHTRKFIKAPKISLDLDHLNKNSKENEGEVGKPVPLPRKERISFAPPNPTPRKSGLESSSLFGSNTSLSSTHSSIESGRRKKKQAPRPPTINLSTQDSAQSSLTCTPCTSAQHSPKSLPRSRKLKKAPPPPTSTPLDCNKLSKSMLVSPIFIDDSQTRSDMDTSDVEKVKVNKDEVNRNRQSHTITETQLLAIQTSYGKLNRGKGRAPSRPIAEKRTVKPFPFQEIKHELDVIEIQMQGLEKQGIRLEELIREKCEGPDSDIDTPIPPEVDNLILELFEIVNEKNGLFRRQAELMYLRRQQRLEEEYADLEYQIRCLLLVPELNKTDSDKEREEELMKRLYEVVERRNEIVECLEMDRVREAEEDDSINNQLTTYSSQSTKVVDEPLTKKKSKKFKFKSSKKIDMDKDIDESETPHTKKEKKKKKFNIF